MSSWFGFSKGSTPAKEGPETSRALPSSWYRSPNMYALERRAIFSKKWIVVSHEARLRDPGQFIRVTEAGFTFIVIKDRKGEIRAHHNICRHRAYPLVEKESGKLTSVLACKYHGWSYGFDGKLAKAPKYQELPSFDKSANGLFPIHVHVDKLGFIWVNLDSEETPVPWEEDFAGVDEQPRLQAFDMSQYHFDHQWEMLGDYNWKTLADNYNECYHCPTGHPALNGVTDLGKYWVETDGGHIQHFNVDKDGQKGQGIYSTFYYPNSSITVSPVFFYIMRNAPTSAGKTQMEYEVYRHNNATDEEFNGIWDFFKQVLIEDKDLCNAAQTNLNAGVFVNGELHPRVEKGPIFFQKLTRSLVMDHHNKEVSAGHEIWPATPASCREDKSEEEIEFCNMLDKEACKGAAAELAW